MLSSRHTQQELALTFGDGGGRQPWTATINVFCRSFVFVSISMLRTRNEGLLCMRQVKERGIQTLQWSHFSVVLLRQIMVGFTNYSCVGAWLQAASFGHEKCVSELVRLRADVLVQDVDGKIARDYAKAESIIKCLQVFLQGSNIAVNVTSES